MVQILLVVQVLVAAALIGIILIQRSETDGFGLGSGGGNNFMSGRSSANLLTRATSFLAALFIINSLVLSVLAARGHQSSIVDSVVQEESAAPSVPNVPLAADDADAKKAVEPATNTGKKQQ